MDDNQWLIELESALMDDCNVNELYTICRGKAIPEALRPDVWQLCLDVRHKPDQMAMFNEIFDLPFQQALRSECDTIVDKLGNDDDERVSVVSDLESILTFYCKTRRVQFEAGNGWIELLLPLLSLKLSRSYTYNLFEAIRDTYIPRACIRNGNVFHVFRLLILYHDPELCSLLDTKKIAADHYAMSWFRSLFAATCPFEVVLAMWDQYFQHSDPFLVFFLALIMLINGRDRILAMAAEPREAIVAFLANMPCALEPDDVVDFCALAQYYSLKTPASFKTDYLYALFSVGSASGGGGGGGGSDGGSLHGVDQPEPADCVVSQALCLPVSVYELIENASADMPHPDAVRFFLVDCRPAEHYNNGHLSTAFHLDSNLMLQEPDAFATAVQGLLRSQRQALEANSCAGGEHLCFMGSGRLDDDQYMYMAVASFLQKGTQFVSLLTGGYDAIHEYFGENMADCLEDHDPQRCLVCNKNGQSVHNNNIQNVRSYTSSGAGNGELVDDVQLRSHRKQQSAQPQSQSSRGGMSQRSSTSDLFSKWSNVMKTKSAEVKGKLLDYIVNPNAPATTAGGSDGGPPSSQQQPGGSGAGGAARNMASVFSIDEDDSISELAPPRASAASPTGGNAPFLSYAAGNEIVQLASQLKSPDVIKAYKCHEVHMNGYMYDSHLIVKSTHLVVLRDLGRRGEAQIIVQRPLLSIVKITAKKRQRDLITFKYGVTNGDTLVVSDMDRFLIPNAGAATELVSQQILRLMDAAENSSSSGTAHSSPATDTNASTSMAADDDEDNDGGVQPKRIQSATHAEDRDDEAAVRKDLNEAANDVGDDGDETSKDA